MTGRNREDERQRAAELVEQTRVRYFAVPAERIEKFGEGDPALKSAFEYFIQDYGDITKTLAIDIYSKDMRFIYELIQNAEDNHYTRICADGQEPFLSFTLYPGRIVIDSNEDGFTESDFHAMCSIRKSKKKDQSGKKMQGYIGEKGIGFKSVFKVAKRVHIQSEPYSFAFEYSLSLDDNGLGMVTPIQEEYEDLPPNVQTRCTLTLLAQSDFEKRAKDLENIPDTLLLFLKTLRKLHVTIRRPTGNSSEVTYSCDRNTTRKLDTIVKRQRIDHGEWTEEVNAFRIAKRTVTNLPHDPSRADIHQADVILAFPVDGEECPVIKQQHVYAYLPLRQVGFPFLIQSDFVTQANREDIFDTARNQALLQGVAETFRDAVLTFCEHESLQYQWMRYLPPNPIFDKFWNGLRPKILNLLSKEPILRSLSGGLYRPLQLCYIPPDFRDRNYDPLFPDLDNEKYLNGRYSWKDFQTLKSLGTTLLKWVDVIDRVEADLDRPDSTMKAPTTNDDWHKRAATVLSKPFESNGPKSESVRLRLRALRLVPTGNNDWISGSEAVYFPTAGGASIPMDLGRNIVVCDAVADEVRRTFFSHLGVRECSPEQVVPWIRERYEASRDSITIEQSISHLQYLFWISPPGQDSLGWNIRLIGPHGLLLRPDEIYFLESADGYSPSELFAKIDDGTPGFSTNFLPSEYIMAMAEDALSHGRSWRTWLEKVLGVQSYPRFLENGELSEDFRYILSHRPERVVGLLQRFWSLYEPNVHLVCEELRHCKIPSETDSLVPLHELYIPLPILKALVDELQIDGPIFLRMPVRQLHDEDEGKWIFLKRIGVRFTDDLEIYLKAVRLRPFNTANWNNPSTPESIFKIYKGIMRKCVTDEEVARVRTTFRAQISVYIPATATTRSSWRRLQRCVWDGPEWLKSTTSLSARSGYADVRHLFKGILKLRDIEWTDFVNELAEMRKGKRSDGERTAKIYHYLQQAGQANVDSDAMRAMFEELSLVFVPFLDKWVPPTACVWANTSLRIPRFTSISTPYKSSESFFCDVLGVRKPTIALLSQALQEIAKSTPPLLLHIKRLITAISAMDPTPMDLVSLRSSQCLPIKLPSGDIRLAKPSFAFAIVDRKEHCEAFEGKINVLDFTPTEIHTCESFFSALELSNLHTSKTVDVKTMVKEGILTPGYTKDFRRKSYALYRCAVHFRSSKAKGKDRSLLSILQNSIVHTSNSISKSLHLIQGSSICTVESSRAKSHLDFTDGQLNVYIPMDKQGREVCYLQELPKRILEFLGLADPEAENLLVKILGSSSLDSVDDILENAGVVEVAGVNRPAEADLQVLHLSGEIDVHRKQPGLPATREAITALPQSDFESQDTELVHSMTMSSTPPLDNLPVVSTMEAPLGNAIYAALLDRLINFGSKAYLPVEGDASHCFCDRTSIFHTFRCSEYHIEYPSIFTIRSQDRDRKVGAAGELFIFELLHNISLPGLSAANWRSTIRKEVRVCDKYSDLDPWNGAETSDFVYHDLRGELTSQLSRSGYFDNAVTSVSEHPTYYIEVKTTTRDCGEPFFMSSSQFKRMQRLTLKPGKPASEIYVLIRVFNLEQESVGLRVFVDPEHQRNAGRLEFSVDTWRVKQNNPPPLWERLMRSGSS